MPTILLYQTDLQGHRFEFLAYLVHQAIKSGLANGISVATPESFRPRYEEIWGAGALEQAGFARLHWLDPRELDPNPVRRNLRNWRDLRSVVRETGAEHVFVDEVNKYLVPALRPVPATLWGILYGPYVRLEKASAWSRLRKRLTLGVFLARHHPARVWVLNDSRAAAELNRIHHRFGRFDALPDPVWHDALLTDAPPPPAATLSA